MADWMIDTFFIFAGPRACSRSSRPGRPGHFHDLDEQGSHPAARAKKRTTTRPTGRSTKRSGSMGMPSGDSPQKAQAYYHYLNAHQQTMQRAATWHVRLARRSRGSGASRSRSSVILLLWVWQYRSTRQKAGIYPVDSFGGYTTELAGPATRVLPAPDRDRSPAFAVVLIVGPHRLGAEVLMAAPQLALRAALRRLVVLERRGDPGRAVAARLRLDAGAEGTRPGVPGLPEARGLRRARGRRLPRPLLHDLGHARAARGVPRARLHVRADARRRRRPRRPSAPS